MFDAGVDLPTNSGARPLAIFITHSHIDHCNALPMLLRHHDENVDPPTQIFAPCKVVHRLRVFAQISWAVKVDIDQELPSPYAPPAERDSNPTPGTLLDSDAPYRLWRPCDSKTKSLLKVGKKANTPIAVQTLHLFHGQCSSIGYLISTPSKMVKKLRPDLVGPDKKATAINVKKAREMGQEINISVEEPEKAHFAFVLDTTIDSLDKNKSSTAELILNCPAVMIECTYLEKEMKDEAQKRGHISWCELAPYIAKSGKRRRDGGLAQTWYLVHFSLRYTDEQIIDFFGDESRCTMRLQNTFPKAGIEANTASPPDIVLWLDNGPVELWIV